MTARPRVLIVEDDHDLRRLYAVGLTQKGFEVLLAGNGADALDRAESGQPDVVLVDIAMPIMDGWELIARLNPPERSDPLPVFVVSGRERPGDEREASIVDWIEKPVSIETLASRLRESLSANGFSSTD